MSWLNWLIVSGVLVALLVIYIKQNDRKLMQLPPEAASFNPKRMTAESSREAAERLANQPKLIEDYLPPKTGRRYIVVGGAGFLGGWIVVHLLKRGEDPRRIRVLDLRTPTRPDLTTGPARDVDFRQVDITNASAILDAFNAPWPETDGPEPELTIFHTAAGIRFYERHPSLVPKSAKVNVEGTRNVISAARAIGASILVYTSSGSITVRRSRFWLWPWEKEPKYFVQTLNDDDNIIPKQHDQFFSNYAVTKREAESLIRQADGTSSGNGVLKTGALRPGNGIFGPGGDILCGAYLVRKDNPTWIGHILQNFAYVENVSLAHLNYEQALLENLKGAKPDLGGQAFAISDPGPPITYGDVYIALSTLTNGETKFPLLSPTAMLLLAHMFEAYYLARFFLLDSPSSLLHLLGSLLPAIGGDLVNLQPSMFALTMVHLIFDDSRARLPPSKGGIGYTGAWTTEEGLCKLVEEFKTGGGHGEERSMGGGVSFGFGLVKAQSGVHNIEKKLGNGLVERLEVDATEALN
ncbi:NAD P-binding protein [Gloeophyllum trabeum ATCC 11539]|uniref:NAD P-binding protein n=1 Tax=Gloeophyllum trabeum (strain ATCC 11539 / FP-39264 / Madison 617) TaxID=670483 RepID=S7Q244_GLOTA|nr:NAD P-binding protein [Gloeophyllum trabeum ATCC 11539]EPQ53633.1 NAD P-binding protein [Gloeophyllum trabeum ATCC 11539]